MTDSWKRSAIRTPSTSTGLQNFIRSLRTPRRAVRWMQDEPPWRSSYVQLLARGDRVTMQQLGYATRALSTSGSGPDDLAIAGPLDLFTSEAVLTLARVCERLESSAEINDYVVTRRLRLADSYSTFLQNMIHDRAFLTAISRLVGVPLIPHPLADARVQINYYSPGGSTDRGDPTIAKWHVDGMDYVFTILLTPAEEFAGGEFVYFSGTKQAFETKAPGWEERLAQIAFRLAGDSLFTRGSRIYHAVMPVTRGKRVTLVLSMFCPYLAAQDSNRFWHPAPDDGLFRTAANWLRFRIPVRAPEYYFRLLGVEPITWEDCQ